MVCPRCRPPPGQPEQRQVFIIPSGPAASWSPIFNAAGRRGARHRGEDREWGTRARMRVARDPRLVLDGSARLTLECGSARTAIRGPALDGSGGPFAVHAYNPARTRAGRAPTSASAHLLGLVLRVGRERRTVSASATVIVDDQTPPTLHAQCPHTHDAHVRQPVGTPARTPRMPAAGRYAQAWRPAGEPLGRGPSRVTYTLTDSGGNSAAPLTRTVDVVNCPW